MNVKLEAALAYSRMRWRIFPCHSIAPTSAGPACSCGKACASPGKHPRTRGGFKDATDDPAQITHWWTRWPDANIALATGSGIAVIDIDGEAGRHEFKALIQAHQAVPETLAAATGRGIHLVFATRSGSPEVRSSARGAVHVRGEGGYIIVAPSNHVSGNNYKWINGVSLATLPDWLRQWSQGYEILQEKAGSGLAALGPMPTHLSRTFYNQPNGLSYEIKVEYSANEELRLKSALASIPAINYEVWFQVGMALKALDWSRSDGTDIGFDLWVSWSETCPEKFAIAACEDKWRSFRRSGVTVGSIYHLAQQHGWNLAPAPALPRQSGAEAGGAAITPKAMNGHHAEPALPAAFLGAPILFPDVNDKGLPRATCTNAGVAVVALGIACEKDEFHEKLLTGGHMIEQWAGDLSDEVIQMLRKTIRAKFGFDPGEKNVRDACIQLALENQFDPVLDYLDGLVWDGSPRIDSWLIRYLGAPDTELNRVIGRLVLIAAVRRQRRPGTKFDQIVVLESREGFGKSTAIEILAGKENFSDQSILNKQEREQQEAMCGVWLYEIADLTGMKKADIEHIKAFASRTSDRARPAYGRFRVDRPRRTIFFASTNDDEYLKSQTGNRRFWPVPVSVIDLNGLRRDRDQLWAEAVACEARGDSIGLPERLWQAAGNQQDKRREGDVWTELISRYLLEKNREDVSVTEVLCDNQYIQRRPDQVTTSDAMRVANILKRLHYEKYRKTVGSTTANRWRRHGSGLEV